MHQIVRGARIHIATSLTIAALVVLTCLPATSFAAKPGTTPVAVESFSGTWQANQDGLPALVLTFTRDGESLAGSAVSHEIRHDGGSVKVAGSEERSLVDLRPNGNSLTFGVEFNNRILQFEMTLLGDGEAELRLFTAADEGIKLRKQQ